MQGSKAIVQPYAWDAPAERLFRFWKGAPCGAGEGRVEGAAAKMLMEGNYQGTMELCISES